MVLTVDFTLKGQHFQGLNGGPDFSFNEAVSFVIECEDQDEVDRLWDALTADGGEPGPCGWLKDRFGLSWQHRAAPAERAGWRSRSGTCPPRHGGDAQDGRSMSPSSSGRPTGPRAPKPPQSVGGRFGGKRLALVSPSRGTARSRNHDVRSAGGATDASAFRSASVGHAFRTGVRTRARRRVRFPSASAEGLEPEQHDTPIGSTKDLRIEPGRGRIRRAASRRSRGARGRPKRTRAVVHPWNHACRGQRGRVPSGARCSRGAGELRGCLPGGARPPVPGPVLHHREPGGRGGADAGRVPQALERWDTIGSIEDPVAWLFRVSLNGFRMRARRARVAARRLVPSPSPRDPFDEVNASRGRAPDAALAPERRARARATEHFDYSSRRTRRDPRIKPTTVRALASRRRARR